jgi:hypothetical protein
VNSACYRSHLLPDADDILSSSRASKSKRADNIHGIDPEWERMVKQRADQRKIGKLLTNVSIADNSDSMAQFGGPIPEGQTDDVEANAIKENKTPHILSLNSGQKPYVELKLSCLIPATNQVIVYCKDSRQSKCTANH